jgi:hypothetical protein
MSAIMSFQSQHIQLVKKSTNGLLRMVSLVLLYLMIFIASGYWVNPYMPDITPEQGPFPYWVSFSIVSILTASVIALAIYSSRWHGWKLILTLSSAYFIVVTVVTQLETWFYLYGITVGPQLLMSLFLQGLTVAFLFIPTAVIIFRRFAAPPEDAPALEVKPFSIRTWVGKFTVLGLACLVIYYLAGYYIAWQNPELRSFYGQSGSAQIFTWVLLGLITYNPLAVPFQILRALIWIAGAALFVRGSRLNRWQTAVLTGFFFAIPQTIGLTLPNPIMPSVSVRLTHLVETAPSVFIFGCLVGWLLYPKTTRANAHPSM